MTDRSEGRAAARHVKRLEAHIQDLRGRLSALEARSAPDDEAVRIRFVREMLETRRRRVALFGPQLFGDPAWDIFLELYLAELEDRRMLVSNVGRGEVAMTTALRWLDRLEADGWLRRVPYPVLGRRTYAVLTPEASSAMRGYVDETLIRQLAWKRELL